MSKTIQLTLKVWRQKGGAQKGVFETYQAKDISTDMSFLEMLDVVNETLVHEGKDPIAFDHDCRERIQSLSTTTAAKGFAEPAAAWSTASPTALKKQRPFVSFT
jgi:succinate dehydrogenase/fumarate reductase-like Fe-S protein